MFLNVQDPGGGALPAIDAKPAHTHSVANLCTDGVRLYSAALGVGRIARTEVEPAPCLLEFGLLLPDPDDDSWLRPVAPSAALAQRLHPWNARSRTAGERRWS